MIRWGMAAAALVLLATPADARHRHGHHRATHPGHARPACPLGTTYDNDGRIHYCGAGSPGYAPSPLEGRGRGHERAHAGQRARRNNAWAPHEAAIVPHPAGCPRVAFCGCGAAVEVFGRPVRNLWLAANWFRFPRAAPAPGMAAVRPHHVMVIRQYLGDGRALVYDANSGGHLTRVHVRSLSGYRIVNPRSG